MSCSKTAIDRRLIIGYGIVFVAVTFMMLQAPLVSDDFIFSDLKLSGISDTMHYVLHYGNGRVLGNLFAVFFVNHKFICAVFKALVITAITYLLSSNVFLKPFNHLSVVTLLVLGVSAGIFSQIYTWTSGFMNYVPPIALMLLCMYIVRRGNMSSAISVPMIVLGCASQLFVEHSTLIHVVLSGCMYIQYRRKQDAARKELAVLWLSGCVLGAAVMVAIPLFFGSSTAHIEGYRSVALSLVALLARTKGFAVSTLVIYAKSTLLFAVSSMTLLYLIGKPRKASQTVRCVIYLLYPLISCEYQINQGDIQSIWEIRFFLLCGGLVVYLATAAYDIVTRIKDRETKLEIFNYLILCIISLIPFCVVSPFSDRCVLLSYFFACMMMLTMLRYTIIQQGNVKYRFETICQCILGALVLFLLVEFVQIGEFDRNRMYYIENAMRRGDKHITIFEIPSQFALDTSLECRFYYYETYGDIEFTIIDYESWQSEYCFE